MSICDIKCKTWHDVLIEKGFDPSTAKSLIGFVSWNKGEEFNHLGREITEIYAGYEGKVLAKDVISCKFNDKGILFFNKEVSESVANKIFDAIMGYEQNNVYNSLK